MQNEELKERAERRNFTAEEIAKIVGGYRLTDGYERDYATKVGVSGPQLSYMKQQAVKHNLQEKFPEHFGTRILSDHGARMMVEALEMQNANLMAQVLHLQAELEKANKRLGKAVNMLLDD